MTKTNGTGATAETSTLAKNPSPPATGGAQAGPAAETPSAQPKRRKRPRAKSPTDKPKAAPALDDEQMADIGRVSVLAAKYGMTVEDYVADLRALVGAYDAMQVYVEASKAQ